MGSIGTPTVISTKALSKMTSNTAMVNLLTRMVMCMKGNLTKAKSMVIGKFNMEVVILLKAN